MGGAMSKTVSEICTDTRLYDSVCVNSIRNVTEVFGGKWAFLVLEQLHTGTMRFNELSKSLHINTKSLTDTLQHLEKRGIIRREVKPTVPVTVEYSLTPKGRDFDGVLLAMKEWNLRWANEEDTSVQ